MTPLEIVTAAIEGTGLKIAPYDEEDSMPTVVLPHQDGEILLAVIDGSALRSGRSMGFADHRPYDPGFRRAIRAVLASEATYLCCNPLTPLTERAALRAFVVRILDAA